MFQLNTSEKWELRILKRYNVVENWDFGILWFCYQWKSWEKLELKNS